MRQFIDLPLKALGFRITRTGPPFYGYAHEKEALAAIRAVRDHTMVNHLGLLSCYEQAVFCEEARIDGSFVECGVWKGGCVGLMALANLSHGRARRHIHLFDSFEGIPECDASVDGERAIKEAESVGLGTSGGLRSVPGVYDRCGGDGSLETNRELLERRIGYDPNYIHYHKGWFQVTLPADTDNVGPIALLRLDSDWYASTKICLQYLFKKVVPGGFVIIDDYGAYEGCQKATNEYFKTLQEPHYLHYVDGNIRYIVKPSGP